MEDSAAKSHQKLSKVKQSEKVKYNLEEIKKISTVLKNGFNNRNGLVGSHLLQLCWTVGAMTM
jgi:hypothetical protein